MSDAPHVPLFADADEIHSYGRAQAIRDGVLVAAPEKLCREAGFRAPIALTAAAHALCVALSPAAERAANSLDGRWWDVLYMARIAVARNREKSEQLFSLYVVTDTTRPSRVTLKITIGPGDTGEPVITILLPDED